MMGAGWHEDRPPQPAARAARETDVAAMGVKDRAGDGEAEPGAAGVAAARGLDAIERGEDPFLLVLGNAGTVIVDLDGELGPPRRDAHARAAGIFDGVVDDIGDGAAKRDRPAKDLAARRRLECHVLVGVGRIVADAGHQLTEIEATRVFALRAL